MIPTARQAEDLTDGTLSRTAACTYKILAS